MNISGVEVGNDKPLILIAGPCQIESRNHALEMADAIRRLPISVIYKSSFDKANRTSLASPRGVGIYVGLDILSEVRETYNIPILTDVHESYQCELVAEHVDVLQIPAMLCRQTDLLLAAKATGKPIHIKKGQFMSPWDMSHVVEKAGDKVLLCERGVTFGYNMLVSDMRSLSVMAQTGHPVTFDATHSVQCPGGISTGGQREFVFPLARAAVAVGVAGVFMEVHQDPDNAPSDGPCMVNIKNMPEIVDALISIDRLIKDHN